MKTMPFPLRLVLSPLLLVGLLIAACAIALYGVFLGVVGYMFGATEKCDVLGGFGFFPFAFYATYEWVISAPR